MTAFGYESLPIRLANLQARLLAKAERRPGRAVDWSRGKHDRPGLWGWASRLDQLRPGVTGRSRAGRPCHETLSNDCRIPLLQIYFGGPVRL